MCPLLLTGYSSMSLIMYVGDRGHTAPFKWLGPVILEKDSGDQHQKQRHLAPIDLTKIVQLLSHQEGCHGEQSFRLSD